MDTVKLYGAVIHHPSRPELLDQTLKSTQPHTFPVRVVCDEHSAGVWPTTRRAIEETPADATHLLLMQDDILACSNFLPAVELAVQAKPHAYLGFYRNAKVSKASKLWVKSAWGGWSYAQVFPISMAHACLSWFDSMDPVGGLPKDCYGRNAHGQSMVHDDRVFSHFIHEFSMPSFLVSVSLVQHMGAQASVLGHNQSQPYRNYSRCFVGAEFDALSIDWSKG